MSIERKTTQPERSARQIFRDAGISVAGLGILSVMGGAADLAKQDIHANTEMTAIDKLYPPIPLPRQIVDAAMLQEEEHKHDAPKGLLTIAQQDKQQMENRQQELTRRLPDGDDPRQSLDYGLMMGGIALLIAGGAAATTATELTGLSVRRRS